MYLIYVLLIMRVCIAYVGMGYLSWVLGLVILGCQNEPLSGKKIVLLPLAASFVMTARDLSMGGHRSRLGVARRRFVLWSED